MRTSESTEELLAALAKAQGELQTVKKTAKNKEFGYAYASLEDYFEAIRPVLAANGLGVVLTIPVRDGVRVDRTERGTDEVATVEEREDAYGAPRYLVAEEWTSKGGTVMRALRLGLELRLFHTSGQWLEVDMIGEAADSSDKRIWKVLTNARKYALANLLNVATGDDAEKDSPEVPARSEAPRAREERPRRPAARGASAPPPSSEPVSQDERHGIARAMAKRIDALAGDDDMRRELMAQARAEILTRFGAVNPETGDLDSFRLRSDQVEEVLKAARTWAPPEKDEPPEDDAPPPDEEEGPPEGDDEGGSY